MSCESEKRVAVLLNCKNIRHHYNHCGQRQSSNQSVWWKVKLIINLFPPHTHFKIKIKCELSE